MLSEYTHLSRKSGKRAAAKKGLHLQSYLDFRIKKRRKDAFFSFAVVFPSSFHRCSSQSPVTHFIFSALLYSSLIDSLVLEMPLQRIWKLDWGNCTAIKWMQGVNSFPILTMALHGKIPLLMTKRGSKLLLTYLHNFALLLNLFPRPPALSLLSTSTTLMYLQQDFLPFQRPLRIFVKGSW